MNASKLTSDLLRHNSIRLDFKLAQSPPHNHEPRPFFKLLVARLQRLGVDDSPCDLGQPLTRRDTRLVRIPERSYTFSTCGVRRLFVETLARRLGVVLWRPLQTVAVAVLC